jgi:hypothetical protein
MRLFLQKSHFENLPKDKISDAVSLSAFYQALTRIQTGVTLAKSFLATIPMYFMASLSSKFSARPLTPA